MSGATAVTTAVAGGTSYLVFVNEFWTAKQRQANALHEIAYRACFKGELPRFFIERLTRPGDVVYDPFSGRGTTAVESALLGRRVIANDINPLSALLTVPRLTPPDMQTLSRRLAEIANDPVARAEIDLSMFFHPRTEAEIVSLKLYLQERCERGAEDAVDSWIRMVATNRLTGHSPGFFSVYTLPPNQAVLPGRQVLINRKRAQSPHYRDTRALILRKSRSLLKDLADPHRLNEADHSALFLTGDARRTPAIPTGSVQLTVTSPPFLNVVHYAGDNWLRCWFNGIDAEAVAQQMTVTRSLPDWEAVMGEVFVELYRVTCPGGWVAFEVGEVRNGKLRLDEHVTPLGIAAGFGCAGVLINQQDFTKTANIWGVSNNAKGTNTNRIVMFYKG